MTEHTLAKHPDLDAIDAEIGEVADRQSQAKAKAVELRGKIHRDLPSAQAERLQHELADAQKAFRQAWGEREGLERRRNAMLSDIAAELAPGLNERRQELEAHVAKVTAEYERVIAAETADARAELQQIRHDLEELGVRT